MARLRQEHLMVMREMVARDVPVRQVARDLGVDESTLRYHLCRGAARESRLPGKLRGASLHGALCLGRSHRRRPQHVVVWAEGRGVARLVIDDAHFGGESTREVLAPTPLGRRAQQQLAATVLERFPAPSTIARPMAQYAHLLDALVGEPS
jgi:hypothetical protein